MWPQSELRFGTLRQLGRPFSELISRTVSSSTAGDVVAPLRVLAALCAGRQRAQHQDGFTPRRALRFRSLQNCAVFQIVLGAQHPGYPATPAPRPVSIRPPTKKLMRFMEDPFTSPALI